jgi:uncharacterized protein (TIGR02594 family)
LLDAVPWCAAFVGAILKRTGVKPSGSLMARSYLNWGTPLKTPKPGAVVVFARGKPPQGHVAFFVKDEGRTILVVGGNQSDAVTVTSYPKARVLGYRWPQEGKMAMPETENRKAAPATSAPPTLGTDLGSDLVAEVPVVNPNSTAANGVGILAAITPIVLWLAQYYGLPLTPADISAIVSGMMVLVGIFIWTKNRYFTAEATVTSANLKGLRVRAITYDP